MGDGVELPRLKRRYADPRVVFTGGIQDELQRIEILRAADAFFLPSLLEAQSLAVLEAMACGVAVVASNVGDQAEVLDGAGRVLNPNHLSAELRSVMRELIESPELCRLMGARALSRARRLFDLGEHVDGLLATYSALVEGWDPTG